MRLGYLQVSRKGQTEKQETMLQHASCERVYREKPRRKNADWKRCTELRRLLEESQPGDTLVMVDLNQLEGHYQVWLEFLKELKIWSLELEILDSPHNGLIDWWQIFSWIKSKEEGHATGPKNNSFSKECSRKKSHYRFFARNPYFRRAYWEILQQVMAKRSLRQISKESGAPLASVVKISNDYAKLKQTFWLIAAFLLTVISLKMVHTYLNNGLLQLVICGVMTLLIIYISYSDSQSE